MQDVLRNRRGLVVSAAVVILCIIVFFLATFGNWRSFLSHVPQTGTNVGSAPDQQGVTVASPAASSSSVTASGPPAQAGAAPGPAAGPATAPSNPASADTGAAPSGSAGPSAAAPAGSPPSNAVTASGAADTAKPTQGALPATPPSTAVASAAGNSPSPTPAAPAPAKGPDASGTGSETNGSPAPAAQTATTGAAANPSDSRTPSFDIIRVEPTGDSVIAARGAPDTEIELLDGGTAIAHARTDANGQVAFLPPALKPGEHNLMLSMAGPGGAKAVSSQSIAVSIPTEPRTAPMVALIQPNQPAAILSGPVAGSGAALPPAAPAPGAGPMPLPAGAKPGEPADAVAIRSVEVESMGSFYATGRAPPGSKSRVYLNDAYVATVTAGPGGNWSLRINRGMRPGHYAVRADQVEPSGRVVARAQVPFDYPAQIASTTGGMDAAKKKSGTANGEVSTQAGSGAPAGGAQGGAAGAGSANPAAEIPPGSHESLAAGSGSPAPPAGGGVGAGLAPAGPPVAALGGAGGPRPETPAHPAAPLPAVVGTGVPPVTRPEAAPPPRDVASAASTGSQTSTSAGANPTPQTETPAPDGTQGGTAAPQDKTATQKDGSATPARPQQAVAEATDDTPTVIEELVTAKVVRGDSLWRISRQMLGHGIRYTQIYAANTQQIRDPRLIYPGQVFVLPLE